MECGGYAKLMFELLGYGECLLIILDRLIILAATGISPTDEMKCVSLPIAVAQRPPDQQGLLCLLKGLRNRRASWLAPPASIRQQSFSINALLVLRGGCISLFQPDLIVSCARSCAKGTQGKPVVATKSCFIGE